MTEVRDHEVIVERAEALQSWLSGYSLSGRAKGALQRELEAIIADGAGSNGDHPLAGLTITEFITALHLPNGGDVGRVKSVGEGVLKELRAAIPPDTKTPRKARKPAKDDGEAKPRRRRGKETPTTNGTAPTNGTTPVEETAASKVVTAPQVVVEAPQAEAPQAEAPEIEAPQAEASQADVPQEQVQPAPRHRGRPRKATQNGADVRQEAPAPAQELTEAPVEAVAAQAVVSEPVVADTPKRRGRPRRTEAPVQPAISSSATNGTKPTATKAAPTPIAAVENKRAPKVSEVDPVLAHIIRLWPSLHPQARKAVVHYASTLLEGSAQD